MSNALQGKKPLIIKQELAVKSDIKIKNVCLDFVKFLLSDNTQKNISNIGLFSVTKSDLYLDGIMMQIEQQLNENMIIKNLF